jgi:hypothetical protein
MSCSDKRAAPTCPAYPLLAGTNVTGSNVAAVKVDLKREELRWVDPDEWGSLAWSCIFGSAMRVVSEPSPERLAAWRQLVTLLPNILPCFSCRHCCAKYLAKYPLPASSGEIMTWLERLRLDVRDRNRHDGDVTPAQAALQDQRLPEGEGSATARFGHRLAFPSLWYTDLFLFLGCVFLVADWSSSLNRDDVSRFLAAFWHISPLPLDWPLPPKALASFDEGLAWLLSGPRAQQNKPAWLAALKLVRLRTRLVCKKPSST